MIDLLCHVVQEMLAANSTWTCSPAVSGGWVTEKRLSCLLLLRRAAQTGCHCGLAMLELEVHSRPCAASGLLRFACLLKAQTYKLCGRAAAGGAQAVARWGLGGRRCHG